MTPRQAPSRNLTAILASARSGALDHAWRQFEAADFREDDPDPAVHTLRGRLLKDRALRATIAADRKHLFAEAARAYARADALAAAPYHLINVATMRFLAGDQREAAALAGQVVDRIDIDNLDRTAADSLELNDTIAYVVNKIEPRRYGQMIKDAFDRLYAEGDQSGTVMCIPTHNYQVSTPHRLKAFEEALEYITGHSDVWVATGREIAEYFLENYYQPALANIQAKNTF